MIVFLAVESLPWASTLGTANPSIWSPLGTSAGDSLGCRAPLELFGGLGVGFGHGNRGRGAWIAGPDDFLGIRLVTFDFRGIGFLDRGLGLGRLLVAKGKFFGVVRWVFGNFRVGLDESWANSRIVEWNPIDGGIGCVLPLRRGGAMRWIRQQTSEQFGRNQAGRHGCQQADGPRQGIRRGQGLFPVAGFFHGCRSEA